MFLNWSIYITLIIYLRFVFTIILLIVLARHRIVVRVDLQAIVSAVSRRPREKESLLLNLPGCPSVSLENRSHSPPANGLRLEQNTHSVHDTHVNTVIIKGETFTWLGEAHFYLCRLPSKEQ